MCSTGVILAGGKTSQDSASCLSIGVQHRMHTHSTTTNTNIRTDKALPAVVLCSLMRARYGSALLRARVFYNGTRLDRRICTDIPWSWFNLLRIGPLFTTPVHVKIRWPAIIPNSAATGREWGSRGTVDCSRSFCRLNQN